MPQATFSNDIKAIFDEFEAKIKDLAYYPKNPIETLKARMTAVWALQSDDPNVANAAAELIKRTSTTKEEDLQRLKALAATIEGWQSLKICSVYENS